MECPSCSCADYDGVYCFECGYTEHRFIDNAW